MSAERHNNIDIFFSLAQYPSSSDEENNPPQPNPTQGWYPQQMVQGQSSQNGEEVINVDEPSMPNISSNEDQATESTPTTSTMEQRREQARSDHQLYWSMIGNPSRRESIRVAELIGRQTVPPVRSPSEPRLRPMEARAGSSDPRLVVPERRPMFHQPVPELSQPPPRPSASADIQSIIAFKRLQRYRAYRHYRAASLGLLPRHPAMNPTLHQSISRVPNRSIHSTPGTIPGFLGHIVQSPMMRQAVGQAHSRARERARRVDAEAASAENENNDDQHSGEESEDQRLSPTLANPEQEDQNSENEVMEVDPAHNNSGPEDEGGEGGESEEDNAEHETSAQAQRSNNSLNDSSNASGSHETPSQSRAHKRRRESAMQNADAFNVKEFNEKLLRLLECPVCLEWMEPPMWQCRRGHLVCARCRARLASCPVCRTSFSSVRNRAMEGVAELLRYPCRHGCGREARLRRRAAHEASCPRRQYRCPAPACAGRAPLSLTGLAMHIKRFHRAMLKTGRVHKFSVRINAQQHDSWLVLNSFGLFHLRIDVDIRTWGLMLYVAYIGPKCWAKEFTYEVTVVGQHNGRKLVYSRATHSDLESTTVNATRQDCFRLTLDQAVNFLRFRNRHCEPDRMLDFTVEISKQDVIIPVDVAANESDESAAQSQRGWPTGTIQVNE